MKSISKLFSIVLFVCLCITISGQHSINGSTDLCHGDCETYIVDNGLGGPYYWISTGSIQESNQGNEVEICWTTSGENDIQLVDFSAPSVSQSVFQTIDIYAEPAPDIIFPLYPTCVIRDSLFSGNPQGDELETVECRTVCSGSTATYSSDYSDGETISWLITGGTILSENQEEIIVEWNESGSGSIEITATNSIGCSKSVAYCLEILEPLEVDILAFNGGVNDITICKGSEVYFQAIGSQNATSFEWLVSNGAISSGESASFIFEEPGVYEITLLGSTECGCFESSTYQVIVDANPGPQIMCTGTTCAGTEETYQAAEACSSYTWSVSGNGSITDGGGPSDDYISINWNTGPVGTVSLSTTGCSTPLCAIETVVEIPILSPSAPINGLDKVCKEGFSRYSVQYYNGTDYQWSISGNGQIIEGQNTNEIVVQWEEDQWSPDQSTLTVTYDNCYLECGGQGSLIIDLLPKFQLSVNEEICSENTLYIGIYDGWDQAFVDVEIIDPDGISTSYSNTSSVNESYTKLGRYQVIATDVSNDFCNDEVSAWFEVIEKPEIPLDILGPTTICKNQLYSYSVSLPGANVNALWGIKDGNANITKSGSSISVEWTSNGPYEIKVRYQLDGVFCNSEFLIVNPVLAQNATISGSSIVCVDELASYSTGVSVGIDAQWSISPSDAGSIQINNDNTIDITWHKPGNHQIQTDFCGTILSYNVMVNNLPEPIATFPDKVCSGEQANLIISNVSASSISIQTVDEIEVANTANSLLDPGNYLAKINDINGCKAIIPIVIDTFPKPEIRVSSPNENAFCLPHPAVTITALDSDDGFTYEWYFNNVPMGETTPSISSSAYGRYYVVVTDENGCTSQSNTHRLYEWCDGDPPGGTCTGGGGPINVGETSITCNNLQFNIIPGGIASTQFEWNFDDPNSGANNTATGNNPIHEFSNAGYYYVTVVGNVNSETTVEIYPVYAAPRFDYELGCAGSEIEFHNLSTFIPGYNITQYNWNFGDPSSGTDNTSNNVDPTHIYTAPGTYTVTLDIAGNNGCIGAYQMDIEVLEGPKAEFVLPYSSCEDEGLTFIGVESDDIISYSWDFGDIASGSANESTASTSIHTFSSSGVYIVSLTVSDINGCETTISKALNVASSAINGDITANKSMPICFQESVDLVAPSGGSEYFWSNGETTSTISTNEPGLYSVTISAPNGCTYEPAPFNIVVDNVISTRLRATVYEDEFDFFGKRFYDSIEICQGDRFDINGTYVFNALYTWSLGSSSNWYQNGTSLNLPVGRNEITLEIEDPNSGCKIDSDPIIVIVNALPDNVLVDQANSIMCEGEVHTLSVTAPDPDLRYFWSNGVEGTTTQVSIGGFYYVSAINKNGCQRDGQGVYISPRPDANRVNIGCTESCFPDTLCTPFIPNAYTYQWLKDGSPVSMVNGNELILSEAGDYQLIVANAAGCADTSSTLSIDAMPSDQSISGLVFIDTNNNGIWDTGEQLLSGVDVSIFDGNTLITSTTTDASGTYLFDPITTVNPNIKIDTTGLGLELTGGLFEMDINFSTCIEDKLQDFPLIKNCTPKDESEEYMVCANETIELNNIILAGGDTWDFNDIAIDGCDSITHVTVVEHAEADVILNTTFACPNTNNGTLDITIMSGSGLQFAIDSPTAFTPDLTFENLTVGSHMLWLFDANGCSKNLLFEIEETTAPDIASIIDNTCLGGANGSIEVSPISGGSFEYSIDGINYSSTTTFENLPAGTLTIYVSDLTTTCIHELPVEILANPAPDFNITSTNTCNNGSNGTINILPITAGNFEYSLDGVTYVTSPDFTDMTAGMHTIYILEEGECPHTSQIEILENPAPDMELTTNSSCPGMDQGSLSITAISSGNYTYSLDGVTFSDDLFFDGLSIGNHDVYILEDGVCMTALSATIDVSPDPLVTFEVHDACIGIANGSVDILGGDPSFEYSIDQSIYSSTPAIADLSAGMHTIYILAENDCVHPFEIEIEEAEEMNVTFEDPELDCSHSEAILTPIIENSFGDVQFLWNDGSQETNFAATENGEYSVDVSDKCTTKSYTWDIELIEVSADQPVYFPNIFSPNQDGINDCFVPTINPEAQILNYHIIIFDRWGNKYFESTDMNECWDGTYNNKNVRAGVFVYYMDIEYTYCVEIENIVKYGDVTVAN